MNISGYQFQSCFAPYIKMFLHEKRAAGFIYESEEWKLKHFRSNGLISLLIRISNPSASISIVCELSRCIGLFPLSGISPVGEDSGSIAIWTTSCLWDVRSRVLAFPTGSGI